MLIRTAAVLAALVLVTVTPIMAADTGAAAAGAAALKKGDRIVFLGDSITAGGGGATGYITFIKSALEANAKDLGVKTVNAGISGNKVPDLQRRLEKDVLSKDPTIVFIYIGINDVWHWKKQANGGMTGGTPKDAYEAGLKDIIGKIKEAGARVILCTPSTIGEKADGSNERDPMLEEYSTISRGVAKDCGVELLDLRKAFIDYEKANNKDNQPKGILTGDGVHLNKEGNKLVAEAMLKVLGVGGLSLKKGDRIVFLGDSITAAGVGPDGYITLIKNVLDANAKDLGVETIGAGISGNKVPDLQRRLERDVLGKNPTIVFIYIGINDVWHWKKQANGGMTGGTPKDAYEAGLKDIIGKIKEAGARVILCTPSTIGEKADGSNERDPMLEEYAGISRNVAKDCGVQLLDLRQIFIDYEKANNKGNQPKGILTSDSVHLNKQGNELVAEAMLKALGVAPAPIAAEKK
jgi:lysophospholipase L1-like esterase